MSPTVPRLERGAGVATPPAKIQTSAGDVSAGLQKTQSAAIQLYENELDRIDEARLNEAQSDYYKEFEYPAVYDPKKGAISLRGRDASGIGEKLVVEHDAYTSEYSKGLTARQSQKYKNWTDGRSADISKWAAGHEVAQTAVYVRNAYLSSVETEKERGSINPANAPQAAVSIKDLTDKEGKRQGWGEAENKQELQKHLTDLHSGAIANLLATEQYLAADEYFKANGDSISGPQKTNIIKALKEGSLRGESQEKSDAIITKGLTQSDALKEAKQIKDPELRDAVRARLIQEYNDKDNAEKNEMEDVYLETVNSMEKNPSKPARELVSPTNWMRLSPAQRDALEQRGESRVNDDKTWIDFIALPPERIEKMSRVEFETKYWTKLDKGHKGRAETLWLAARESGGKGGGQENKYTVIITPAKMTENTWQTLGLGNPSDNPEEFAKFEQEVQQQVNLYEATALGGKRKAAPDEIHKIINDIAMRDIMVKVDRWGWWTGTREIPVSEKAEGAEIEGAKFKKQGKVKVVAPNGKIGYLPSGDIEEAKKAGWKEVK